MSNVGGPALVCCLYIVQNFLDTLHAAAIDATTKCIDHHSVHIIPSQSGCYYIM